jgi:hypothetical protein
MKFGYFLEKRQPLPSSPICACGWLTPLLLLVGGHILNISLNFKRIALTTLSRFRYDGSVNNKQSKYKSIKMGSRFLLHQVQEWCVILSGRMKFIFHSEYLLFYICNPCLGESLLMSPVVTEDPCQSLTCLG